MGRSRLRKVLEKYDDIQPGEVFPFFLIEDQQHVSCHKNARRKNITLEQSFNNTIPSS